MTRFKKMQPEKKEGKIVYGNAIVDNIVCLTVEELPFVELVHKVSGKKKNSAVTVFLDKKGLDVDICVRIHFSQRVSEIVFKIQEAVRHSVESMTEYRIQSVNVIVMGVIFDDVKVDEEHKESASQENNSTEEKESL
ncbi:MAG: Asp23/Gls24 family envelope stress response protein [Clostridia bacterium]|nr:Asp23/Gls24 family envelope stress response protein [Clostridia bacterium]